MALERMKSCDNVSALAKELGIHRKRLYEWRDQAVREKAGPSEEELVRKKIAELEKLAARQELEIEFLKGCLKRVQDFGGAHEAAGSGESGG
jgi:transposase-like protein